MASATPEEFASRAWRVQGISTLAKQNGSGRFTLFMKYRTSATHSSTTYAPKSFSSHDPSYAKLWDSKEEALQPENVQHFRDFVQRGFTHGGGSPSAPKRPHEDMEGGAQQEEPRLRGSARHAARYALLAEKAAGGAKAAYTRMANFIKGGRKKLGWRHGAVKQPNRKAQRKEEQGIENAHKQLARSTYRQEQIAILQHAMRNGICTDVLVPLDEGDVGSDVSHAQSKRALIQCMVVLEFFMLLEAQAQQNGEELPVGGVYETAAQAGECALPQRDVELPWAELGLGPSLTCDVCPCVHIGKLLGLNVSERTVRNYYYQWINNDSQLLRDKRGKHAREMIVNEEDVGNKLRKWARKNADGPKFVDKATEYINEKLLPGLPAGMLAEYKITLPVARSTAHRWLAAADIRRGWATQNYYNDNHQSPLVLKQRAGYIPVRAELEKRQPLWIRITSMQKEAMEKQAKAQHAAKRAMEEESRQKRKPRHDRKGREIVPDVLPLKLPYPYHEYEEDGVTWYEYHVDDAECFHEWRMEQRLGGCFTKKWGDMPAESDVSAPDSNLLEAGVTLSDVGGAGGAAAGDGGAAAGDAALDAAAAGDGGGGTAAGAAAVAGEGDDELEYRGEPTSCCKWSEAACRSNKNLSDLRKEIERIGLTPIADGAGSGTRGKVLKADLADQLKPYCKPPGRKGGAAPAAGAPAAEEEEEEEDSEWKLDKIIGRKISVAGDEYKDADGETCAYPPGIILWKVRWEALEGQPAEETWEAEWQVEGAQAAVHEYMGSCTPHAWCKHKHHPDVCKCKLPLWHLGQDEKIWKAYQMQKATWLVKSVRALRKKTDGPGKMASGHQDELRGFGFRMSAAELRKVNEWRAVRKRPPLDSSPGLQFLQYGKNREGYWDAEMFGKQIDRILDCFDCLHPDWQLCLEVCAEADRPHVRVPSPRQTNDMGGYNASDHRHLP